MKLIQAPWIINNLSSACVVIEWRTVWTVKSDSGFRRNATFYQRRQGFPPYSITDHECSHHWCGLLTHFTNDFWCKILIWWKFNCVLTLMIAKRLPQNFAHGMIAVLSCHVQKFIAMWWPCLKLQQNIFCTWKFFCERKSQEIEYVSCWRNPMIIFSTHITPRIHPVR